jgi:intraflagellar transport protein 172
MREEVRDWVLQVSLDQKVNQEIDYRDCTSCGSKTYDASLVCFNCKHAEIPCIVTGNELVDFLVYIKKSHSKKN